jgi:hypothetical protein
MNSDVLWAGAGSAGAVGRPFAASFVADEDAEFFASRFAWRFA